MITSNTSDAAARVVNFDHKAAQAERFANELLSAWCTHGYGGCHLAPELFPTQRHQDIARIVISAIDEGERGWAEICTRFLDDEKLRQSFITAMQEQPIPTNPDGARRLIERLIAFQQEKQKIKLAQRLVEKIENGESLDEELGKLHEINTQLKSIERKSLLDRAYSMRFDPAMPQPQDEVCMTIGDYPIAARGNLTVIQGKSKVGKSAIFSAVLGAAIRSTYATNGDTLCIEWSAGETGGAIIHLDTEQSLGDWHAQAARAVMRSGIDCGERFISLPLVMFNRSERMQILRQSVQREHSARGGIDLVVIDGVADLCTSPNDEAEALELVSELHAMAQRYACPIFCGLHENPGSDQGKTRGHLGSELNRKAFANLRCDKNTATGVSTLYGTDMRKREIAKDHGFCFAYDTEAGMHTFHGRAAGVAAAQAEVMKKTKVRKEWEEIFEQAENGTNACCPELSPNEAREAIRDMGGTKSLPSVDSVKKRMQRAESLGVLRKAGPGKWAFIKSGHFGT